ncbi:MAG: SidE phosphodiesterase domain-containing protein [Coxiellaceae bacterium]|nr:SidE phosphodiesterase domain-containing protein [Coxiellaceae bacterium]
MRLLSEAAEKTVWVETRDISHPLIDAVRVCRITLSESAVNLRTGINWFSRSKAGNFQNIKAQLDGDLVRAQPAFTDRAPIPQHELMMMAAMLAAHLKQFRIKGKPLIIPCSGEVITSVYYRQANKLLQSKVEQLQQAYRHYCEKLQELLRKTDSSDQKKNVMRCANKLKQVQQILAGALFLQQQYQSMQLYDNGRRVMTAHSFELSAGAIRSIARQHRAAGLNPFDDNTALQQAAVEGDIEQMAILLVNPAVKVNRRDRLGRSPLNLAAQYDRLDAVKFLMSHGAVYMQATAAEDSAFTVALLNGHRDMVRYLSSCTPVESNNIQHTALHQGPVKKNVALRHVEYVLHCMLGADFVSYPNEGDYYAKKTDGAGVPYVFRLEKNENSFVIVHCPNGQVYNLSLALKYANLCYFHLTESEHDHNLVKLCEKLLKDDAKASIATILTSQIGSMPAYAAEQAAIREYTGQNYKDYNDLLRGEPMVYYGIETIKIIFVRAVLAISGVNKNLKREDAMGRINLVRTERALPGGMLMQMKTSNQLVWRPGLLSFSDNGNFDSSGLKKLQLDSDKQWQGDVAGFSDVPYEREVLFPPSCVRFTAFEHNLETGEQLFTTEIVRGVATAYQDDYFIQQALSVAFEILKRPYRDTRNARFDIARHNHALAHHIRVSMFIEPVIDYFKQFAASVGFREFCDSIQPEEIIIMKIMMIFSKTGRESEVSPIGSGQARYMEYQQASANNFRHFMREVMHYDEATIEYYAEIMVNMGNPYYPELVTGANDEEKQRKLYINNITALSHKLDLPRVYGKSGYVNTMSGYNGFPQRDTGLFFIGPSEQQVKGLAKLETIAFTCLKATGDNLCFSGHGIDTFYYAEGEFKRCNTDIDHCLEQCQIAYMAVMQQSSDGAVLRSELKQAIDDNDITKALRVVARTPVKQLFKRDEEGRTMFDVAIESEHSCCKVIDSLLLMSKDNQTVILKALHAAIRQQKHDRALLCIQHLSTSDLNKRYEGYRAIVLLLEVSGNLQVLEALLAKSVNVNSYNNAAVRAACINNRAVALERILEHSDFDRATLNSHAYSTNSIFFDMIAARVPLQIFTVLVRYGAKIVPSVILYAISIAYTPVVHFLIGKAEKEEITCKKPFGKTLIANIMNAGSYHLFFSNVELTDPRTLLLKLLMERGCNLYYCCDEGDSVLSKLLCVENPPFTACKYVINNAPLEYLNSPIDKDGKTPLMIAADTSRYELAELLLQRRVDVSASQRNGITALMYAVFRGRSDVAWLFLRCCLPSDFTQRNEGGHSALSIAIENAGMSSVVAHMVMNCPLDELHVGIIRSLLHLKYSDDFRSELFEHIMLEADKLILIPPKTQELIDFVAQKKQIQDGRLVLGLFRPAKSVDSTPQMLPRLTYR